MPTLTFTSKYKKNTGLIMSAAELSEIYLYGVVIKASDGTDFPSDNIRFYIESAQREIEDYLKIKFNLSLFNDNGSYNKSDYFNSFPIIQTRYAVVDPLSLIGFYKKIEQIVYPKLWLSAHKNGDGIGLKRIHIVPTSGAFTATGQDVILSGVTILFGSLRTHEIMPDYWQYQYTTGFTPYNIPMDLVNLVGKLASIGVFNIAGDLILGAGIASQSLGIDGLSQSIATTSSATAAGYSSRIIQYQKEIKETLSRIERTYKGMGFTVL